MTDPIGVRVSRNELSTVIDCLMYISRLCAETEKMLSKPKLKVLRSTPSSLYSDVILTLYIPFTRWLINAGQLIIRQL